MKNREHFLLPQVFLVLAISFGLGLDLDLGPGSGFGPVTSGLALAQERNENPLTATARLIPFEIESGQIAQLDVKMQLPAGYKAYEDQFRLKILSPEGIKIAQFKIEPLQEVFDKFSKKQKKVISGDATMTAVIELGNLSEAGEQKIVLDLTYQACTDTYCLFPKTTTLDVYFKAKASQEVSKGIFQLSFRDAFQKGTLWAFLFVFIFGFLTSFTPCVYPMIPITLAILGREAHARTRLQNFTVSLAYVMGIALTFSLLGVFAASTGALFGSLLASPWVLGMISLIFFVMSLSMFGIIQLEAPRFFRDGFLSHIQLHGYVGAFISGMLAGVVASPCVGPVLVGVLTFVAQTQNTWLGFWLLFVYALGMGLLFLGLGLSTNLTKLLPKSGAWMNRVKVFFGLLLLGASLYYLDVLLVSSKVYKTSAITRLLNPSTEKKTGFKIDTMNWQTYSDEVLEKAAQNGKPVIIDFRADWCAACLELEEKTFTDQELQLLSSQFVMVKFDATQDSPKLIELRKKYRIVGLPTVVFISKTGKWLEELTLTEFEPASKFKQRMEKAR